MKDVRVRWWPLNAVAAFWLGAQVWIWALGDRTGQDRVMLFLLSIVVALLLALVWLLLLSRLAWRRRLVVFALFAAIVAGLVYSLEIRGVSGDLMPILTWRWSAGGAGESSGVEAVLRGPLTDYPQFLGPERNATVRGIVLARDWSASPPRELWRRPIGEGWSAFAVADRLAVTQEQRGDDELVVAYQLASGRQLWEHADRTRYETTIAGVGPRATPTIVDGRVFTLGATGRLNALALETGRSMWAHDLESEFSATTPEWGRPGSPLVIDGLVVVSVGASPGASLVAFDAESGELIWQAGSDRVGYSSPMSATLAGTLQIVIFNRASVAGHDVGTGRMLWSYPWSFRQPNVAQPLVVGDDRLLVSSGYGEGSRMLRIERDGTGFTASLVWESPRLKAKFTNVVLHEGFVYGLDDGVLVCLDPATGERCWKRGRYGHGQVILVDDLLLVQSEKGEVVLLEPNPDEHRELGRFRAFDDKTWNSPALVGRYLLLRNHREAALFELPLAAG
ncbi:MAG: PQQ-like beta-propeller repeat protein [Acidobacteria bacterium]|nr:PQQ-like beta-propeller repeat protein [Acidobacteriota bacterium]